MTGLLFSVSSREFVEQWDNITPASMTQLHQMMIYSLGSLWNL